MVQNRVRKGCFLSPTLFSICIERIMSDALEEHDGKVSISSRNSINLQFADDIDVVAEEEQEQETLVESLNKTCTRYKMEINAEEIKLMTNNSSAIPKEIKVKGQKLGNVTSFIKYLGAVGSCFRSLPKTLDSLMDCASYCSSYKAEANLEREQHIFWIKGEAGAFSCHFHILYAYEW